MKTPLRITFLICFLSLLSSLNLHAAGSIMNDHAQKEYSAIEGMSERQAMFNRLKCLDSDSTDPCKDKECEKKFCLESKRKMEVDSGACYGKIQAVKKCREDYNREHLEATLAVREEECKELKKKFDAAFAVKDMDLCRRTLRHTDDCTPWSLKAKIAVECYKLHNKFKEALRGQNHQEYEERIVQGNTLQCEWAGSARAVVCQENKRQFEDAFTAQNISLSKRILSGSIPCRSWFRSAELRLQELTTSTLEAAPARPFSECFSMEKSFNDAFRAGNDISAWYWLENSSGCSWRAEALRRYKRRNPTKNTIGSVEPQYGSDQRIVPMVENESLIDAIRILKNVDLLFAAVGGDPAPEKGLAGHVQEQRPKQKTLLSPGSYVTLVFYSDFKLPADQRIVPTITTLKLGKAKAALDKQGLGFNPVYGDRAPTKKQVGKIQSQEPVSGECVKEGEVVKARVYAAVVPAVLKRSVTDAKGLLRAAWFKPNPVPGEAVKNELLWNTIYFQSLPDGEKVEKLDTVVTVKYYIKPEPKKKNPYRTLLGIWQGQGFHNKNKKHMRLEVFEVDAKGNFTAHFIWPKQKGGCSAATTLVKGHVQGTNIFFQEVKVLKVKDKCKLPKVKADGKPRNKYVGMLSLNHGTIKGKFYWFGNPLFAFAPDSKDYWLEGYSFQLKKQ